MTAATPAGSPTAAALRAEHDELARRLEVRTSIDLLRKALYTTFFGLIGAGTSVKLGWDRWGTLKPGVVRKVVGARPLFLYVATTITVVLLVVAVRWLLEARRRAREEDRLFARFRELRATLGLEA
jgi:hypothetical protein